MWSEIISTGCNPCTLSVLPTICCLRYSCKYWFKFSFVPSLPWRGWSWRHREGLAKRMQHRPTLLNPTLLNEMLYNVERGDQTNATCLIQHLDSRVWDQNLPRILGKQTSAILLCTINGRRPIAWSSIVGPSSRLSWSYSFTYSFALSLSNWRVVACV